MSFAKNILEKYGWKEGDGLGKNATGIVKPIKASLKFNQSGLGVDQATDLTNNWWERVFNEAANNLEVNTNEGNVSVSKKEEDGVEITNKGYSVKKLKNKTGGSMTYGTFLKSSTLLANVGREEDCENHVKTEEIEFGKTRVLTDEELFQACGGRTAHKGARHGLNLTGKLSRIEEQNNLLLKKMQEKSFEEVIKTHEWQTVKKSKKPKKAKKKVIVDEDEKHPEEEEDELKDMLNRTSYILQKSSKKCRKEKKHLDEISKSLNFFETLNENTKKIEEEDAIESEIVNLNPQSKAIKKKKDKKKKKNKSLIDIKSEFVDTTSKFDKKTFNESLKKVANEIEPVKEKKVRSTLNISTDQSSDDEDIVEKINEERSRIMSKMKSEELKNRHLDKTNNFGKANPKKKNKKSKKRDRKIAELANKIEEKL